MITLTGFLVCTTAEEAARVRTHLPDHIALTLAEPGCLSFQVTPTGDPMVWQVAETFTDRAAFEAHQSRAARSAWAEASAGVRRDYSIRED